MRETYHLELDAIGGTLVEMAGLVGVAVARATAALLDADLQIAESVIAADDAVDALQRELDARALELLARQQPVAGDLRSIVTSLRMSADLERMGDLARHIAKVARLRHPDPAVPVQLRETIAQMGQIAQRLAEKTITIIEVRDTDAARELPVDDNAMDLLHRGLLAALVSPQAPYSVQTAIDVALLSRYYERFADHAVSVAQRVIFLVTGESEPRAVTGAPGSGIGGLQDHRARLRVNTL
jgi:phosphate transport system protein